MDVVGVRVERYATVSRDDEVPHVPAEVRMTAVRQQRRDTWLHTDGGGFEASQSWSDGMRLDYSMRLVGALNFVLELMVRQASERQAFG